MTSAKEAKDAVMTVIERCIVDGKLACICQLSRDQCCIIYSISN